MSPKNRRTYDHFYWACHRRSTRPSATIWPIVINMALYSLHVDIHYPKSTGQAQSRPPALVSPNRKRQLHSLADSTEIASTPETQNRVIKCQTKCNGNGEGHFARLQLHKRKLTKRKSYIFFPVTFSHGVGFICANIRAKLCTVN